MYGQFGITSSLAFWCYSGSVYTLLTLWVSLCPGFVTTLGRTGEGDRDPLQGKDWD